MVKTENWTKFDASNIKLLNGVPQNYIFTSTGNIKFLSKTGDADEYFLFHLL